MKIVAIILLIVLVFTQSPFGQLLKIPTLMEHFYKHKKLHGVSLFGFLKDHYAKEHKDADQSEDEQLPFKTAMVQSIGFALVPAIVKADFSIGFDVPKKITVPNFFVPQHHLCNIFHPPRA